MNENRILWLERKLRLWQQTHTASFNEMANDDELLIMLLSGDDADAKEYMIRTYAYCEEHDDTHGDCEAL